MDLKLWEYIFEMYVIWNTNPYPALKGTFNIDTSTQNFWSTFLENDLEQKKKSTHTNLVLPCEHFERSHQVIETMSILINRKGVIFHLDNAQPHTSLMTRQKLLGWGKSNFGFVSCFLKRIYSYKLQTLINDICAVLINDLSPLFW